MIPAPRAARNGRRTGAVLILVVGMTAMLAALALVFLARMRADAEDSAVVGREVQARLMWHAALMYLQETSVIGWGPDVDPPGAGGRIPGSMAFGWTDLRNGSLGPRGQRGSPGVATGPDGLPVPTWWQSGWGTYVPSPLDAQLPAEGRRRWPCPGSAVRIGMGVPVRTPYAIQATLAPNPLLPLPAHGTVGDAAWDATEWNDGADRSEWPSAWTTTAYRISGGNAGTPGALDPQPVSDTWAAFSSGLREGDALAMRPGTEGGWFRIYREVLADHDNDGSPAYDLVALHDPATPQYKNWNVFIIACGSGSTRGFRFWDLPAGDPRRALEPVTARESGHWTDQAIFETLRSSERIRWYRVEWTGHASGGLGLERDEREWLLSDQVNDRYANPAPTRTTPNSKGGSFAWIQPLTSEPEKW